MTDNKFASEYKAAVGSINLPDDYKAKILSNLKAADLPPAETQETKETNYKKNFRLITSLVAASLVIAVGLSFLFSLTSRIPATTQLRLNVCSATNLSCISGAKVVFRNSRGDLLEDENGEVITAFTDENGVATATVPATETYQAEISMDGYITTQEDAQTGNYYISPVMNEDTYRAVLTWEEDCDLDAHLSYSDENGTQKLFYFNSDIENAEGEVIAALDTDSDKPGFPETITFNADDSSRFCFSVVSYTSLKTDGAQKLSDSGAQVAVYKGNELIGKYTLDTTSQGNVWCVFEIENAEFNICDYTYSVSAVTDIK